MAVVTNPDITDFIGQPWSTIEPRYRSLRARPLSADTVDAFLADWSWVAERVDETYRRLEIATTQDVSDTESADTFHVFLDEVHPKFLEAEQSLREKLLESGLQPDGFAVQLRKMRVAVDLYRLENLPLLAEEKRLTDAYFQITGAQTVVWEGEEVPLSALSPVYEEIDRDRREKAWRLSAEREFADRDAIHANWVKLLDVREKLAANAGLPDYRAYRWRQLARLDYTPADCIRFHEAVEQVVVPAARRLAEKRCEQLGAESLRPWDEHVDPLGRPPLKPFDSIEQLNYRIAGVFHALDPQLGSYFDTLVSEGLLDLEVRKNKAPVGYCLPFNASRRAFIFLSLAGTHGDVVDLLHEGGHAFHVFEMAQLPYLLQRDMEQISIEFGEVGSMAMEFLAAPYLREDKGGFYSAEDADRAMVAQLSSAIRAWCGIAMVDAFQHWVYEHPDAARDRDRCDAKYWELTERFVPDVDFGGLEPFQKAGWQIIPHIHEIPFYFVEYGFAQLGAAQIWMRARKDHAEALASYRHALSLGETVGVPALFQAAGVRFAMDADTLRSAVDAMESTINQLG